MTRRVVVTGLGVVSGYGGGKDTFWDGICAGRSAIGPIQSFDASEFRTQVACECTDFDPLVVLGEREAPRVDRFSQMALAAADEAMTDSGLAPNQDRTGVLIGSGMAGATTVDEQHTRLHEKGVRWVNPLTVPMVMHNAAAGLVSMRHALRGPSLTVSTACASGAHAIGEAFRMIEHGYADAMVAGGTEAPMSWGVFAVWNALRVMATRNEDPTGASRPFSEDRTGFVMGEGAAMVVLEERDSALKRGAPIYAELIGYAVNNDAFHATRPSIEGESKAIRLALDDAGIKPEEVDYINAHGTATQANDASETAAIKEVFGDSAYNIPTSSIKSMIGHSIGAAGAIELAACCLTIRDQIIAPTINLDVPSPECDLDYVPNQARQAKVHTVVSNSFGFGGCNAILVVRKDPSS